jgi:hypothetical protein
LSIPDTRPTLKLPEEHWISTVELPEERSAPRSFYYISAKKKRKEKKANRNILKIGKQVCTIQLKDIMA